MKSKITLEKINNGNEAIGYKILNGSTGNNEALVNENDVNMECFDENEKKTETGRTDEQKIDIPDKDLTEENPAIPAEVQVEKPIEDNLLTPVEVEMEKPLEADNSIDQPTENSNEKSSEELYAKPLEDSNDKLSENSNDKIKEISVKSPEDNEIEKNSANQLEKNDSSNSGEAQSEDQKIKVQSVENLEDASMPTSESDKNSSEPISDGKLPDTVKNE